TLRLRLAQASALTRATALVIPRCAWISAATPPQAVLISELPRLRLASTCAGRPLAFVFSVSKAWPRPPRRGLRTLSTHRTPVRPARLEWAERLYFLEPR